MLVDVDAVVKFGGIKAMFVKLGRRDFSRVFRELRKPTNADMRDHKNRMRGPRGPWPYLASTTIARRVRMGQRQNRQILARLPGANRISTNADRLLLKSRVRWSLAHQDGPTRVGHGAIVPQRQYLWIGPRLVKQVKAKFEDALYRRWMGIP